MLVYDMCYKKDESYYVCVSNAFIKANQNLPLAEYARNSPVFCPWSLSFCCCTPPGQLQKPLGSPAYLVHYKT